MERPSSCSTNGANSEGKWSMSAVIMWLSTKSNRRNQKAEIWFRTAPLSGIGSGKMTSKAERRSVATKRRVSPRSKTSRTLPERNLGMPESSRLRNGVMNNHYFFMAGIVVKPRARIFHGHDWVFSGEVLKVFGNPADGDVISLKDGKDRLIGSAIYNSKSQSVARRFSRRKQDLDLDLFQRRIAQAAEYRARRGIDSRLCRVVWSESDGLPGVIADRYGDHVVLQTLTLAMDMRKQLIVEALRNALGQIDSLVERNDAPVRRAEGMEPQVGVLFGE